MGTLALNSAVGLIQRAQHHHDIFNVNLPDYSQIYPPLP